MSPKPRKNVASIWWMAADRQEESGRLSNYEFQAEEKRRARWMAADRQEESGRLSNYEFQAEEKRRARWSGAYPEAHARPLSRASVNTEQPPAKAHSLSNVRPQSRNPIKVVRSIWRLVSSAGRVGLRQPEQDSHHAREAAQLRIAWEIRKEELRLLGRDCSTSRRAIGGGTTCRMGKPKGRIALGRDYSTSPRAIGGKSG